MARVPKMTRGKISLARGIHCCLYCAEYVFVCMYVYTYIYIHTSDCVEILYELPLLRNSNNFAYSGAVRNVDWIFIIWAPAWR